MAKLGYYNKTTSKAYIGSTAVKKIYYGSTLIYSSKPQLSTPTLYWSSSLGRFYWTGISNASRYNIYVDGTYQAYTSNTYWYPPSVSSPSSPYAGTHNYQILAYPSNTNTYDPSNLSTAYSLTRNYRLATPSLTLSGDTLQVSNIDVNANTLSTYSLKLYFNGSYIETWNYQSSWYSTNPSFDIGRYDPVNGTEITVQAVTNDSGCDDSYTSSSVTYSTGGGGGSGGHVTLEYSIWSHGQNDIGSIDITVYDANWNMLGYFNWGDNQISFDSPTSTIYIEGPSQYDASVEVTLNVWGGTGGDLYESGPGDGPVTLAYTISDGDSLSVDYYYDYY